MQNGNTAPTVPAKKPALPPKPKSKVAKKETPTEATGSKPRALTRTAASEESLASRFRYVFGPQDKAVHDYLRCVFNPSQYKARVPVSRGGFELFTQLWSTSEQGSFVAGSDGTGFVGVCAANWVESGNVDGAPALNSQILGYTHTGFAALCSNSGEVPFNGTFPEAGSTPPNTLLGTLLDRPTDQPLTATTRIRLVAMELQVYPDLALQTAKGEVAIFSTANPVGGVRGGSLNGAAWNDLAGTNASVITASKRAIPGWSSGEVLSAVALPGEEQAYEMVVLPEIASTSPYYGSTPQVPNFHIGALARGMAPGDRLMFTVTYVWETEMARSNSAESGSTAVVHAPVETVNTALAMARPLSTNNRVPGVHAIPLVQTLHQTSPAAITAIAAHPAIAPHVGGSKQQGGMVYSAPSSGFMSTITNLAKNIVGSGVLSKIPVIGPVLGPLASVFAKLFD